MIHPVENELHDWIDGLLAPARAAEVESHVAECDACAADVAAFRALLAELGALPKAVEPARDLRPGIAAAIDGAGATESVRAVAGAGAMTRASWWDRPLRTMRVPLAAAALALVALSSVITMRVLREPAAPGPALAEESPVSAVEARYAAAIGELETLLRDRRAELPPEALRLLGESLAIVDAALAETRAALRTEPDNPALPTVLLAAYERKLELLRGAAALEADT